ncbi:MAG: hypothetical protein H6811_12240 [Phycisphaeraceae bacterium]|nr:hypothetical protein [Phycisphaeraceae bacterium]
MTDYNEDVSHSSAPVPSEVDALITDVRRLGLDFAKSVSAIHQYATRCPGLVDTHIFFRVSDLLIQSGLAGSLLLAEGMRNPGRREARFLLEASVKLLFVDQSMPTSTLEHRLVFYERKVSSSGLADELKGVKFGLLASATADELVRETLRLYGHLSQFVHISHEQVAKHLEDQRGGLTIGFDTLESLGAASSDLFRVYDLAIVACLHAIGPSLAGDMMVALQDSKWVFHAGKYLSDLDAHYDYKAERQSQLEQLATRREEVVRVGWRAQYAG